MKEECAESSKSLSRVADVLETHFEEILAVYERRLLDLGGPTAIDAALREQLKEQARSVLHEVARDLREQKEPSSTQQ